MHALFIYDWMWQLYEGNPVAYLALGLAIAIAAIVAVLLLLIRKLPAPAKTMWKNELRHGNNIIADCYDDKFVCFETPPIYGEGLFYEKKRGVHFLPSIPKSALSEETLSNGGNPDIRLPSKAEAIAEFLGKAFHIGGTSSRFYFAYSGRANVVNPEIQAFLEHERIITNKTEDAPIDVPKEALLKLITELKDKTIRVKPMWISLMMDPRTIKRLVPEAWDKSKLEAYEWFARNQERHEQQGIGGIKTLLILILLAIAIMGIVLGAKLFGAF
jgi:hypothetical protein